MINLRRLVHFTIPVTDLQRSESFYTHVLGLRKVGGNPLMAFLRTGEDIFVLTKSKMPINPNPDDESLIHTAFLVDGDQFDDAVDHLRDAGAQLLNVDERREGTFQGRSAYFHDPDRNVIELIDLQNDPWSAK